MEMDSILAGLEIEENRIEILNCPKNENNKKFEEQNNLDDDFPSNSGEELSKLFSKICELNGKKEKLEEICPNLLLAIRKYFQCPKGANAQSSQYSRAILSRSFGICQELAKIEGSKLVRKSASAALRILLGTKNEENEQKGESSKSEMGIWDAFLTLLDGLEEPQYHLVLPMLPKFEILIKFVAEQPFSNSPSPADQFSWPWLRLLLEKAINHPNGWIRIWALQRAVKMPKELHRDNAFILSTILPAMNGIDPLWRMAERRELDNFIGQLAQMLANSLEWCSSNEKVDFIISLLELISNPTKLWRACPLYFLSKSLNFGIQERNIFPENAEFDPNWRRLFFRIADIPHISLRIATNLNFFRFFIQLHFWKNDFSQKFAYFLTMNLQERGLKKEEYGKMIGKGIELFCGENLIVDKFDEILEKLEEIRSANINLKEEKGNFLLIPSNSEHQSALECIENLCEFILETSNFESICENLQKIEKIFDKLEIAKLDSNEFGHFLANLINRLYRQCHEQRKSRNFLPNLKHFLRICFHQKILEFAEKNEEKENELMEIIQGKFEDLFGQSQLNTSIGLLLARQMFDARIFLKGEEWAEKLIKLATFGPVIKRECRILCLAYQQIYDETENGGAFLPMEEINLLHLCAHQCRLLAVKTICAILVKFRGQNEEFADSIFIGIFQKFDQLNKTKSSSYGLSMGHRLKTRLAQLLVLILDFANSKEMVNSIFDHCVVNLLDPGQQYSIKLLFEWILLRILAKFPELLPKFLELEKKFVDERIGSISSWLNIFHHFFAQNDTIDYLRIFFSRILPWSTSQNFSIRCTALAALRLAWNRNFPKLGDLPEFSMISNLAKFDLAISTGNSTRIINSLCDDFYFAHFHPIRHFSLQTIFQIFPEKTGMPGDEIISTKLLMSNFGENFANEFGQWNLPILCDDRKFVEAPSLIYSNFEKKKEKIVEENGNSKNELEVEELGEVQRKLNIFEGNGENIGDKPELIVCATLINKTANLGGLCRTCEIFNVRSLCISNKMLVESVDFKALSLNAENWLHIEQVKSKDLFEYLRQKREQEGFQCIAAEQTTKSVPLENFQFPRRSILLLGDEKEGIPVELFGQVDCTVEITQLGKTRSLNVHVSAALCIHQFAAQFLMKRGK